MLGIFLPTSNSSDYWIGNCVKFTDKSSCLSLKLPTCFPNVPSKWPTQIQADFSGRSNFYRCRPQALGKCLLNTSIRMVFGWVHSAWGAFVVDLFWICWRCACVDSRLKCNESTCSASSKPPKFAQPSLSKSWTQSSTAKGYNLGVFIITPVWGCKFGCPWSGSFRPAQWGCANLGVFGARWHVSTAGNNRAIVVLDVLLIPWNEECEREEAVGQASQERRKTNQLGIPLQHPCNRKTYTHLFCFLN